MHLEALSLAPEATSAVLGTWSGVVFLSAVMAPEEVVSVGVSVGGGRAIPVLKEIKLSFSGSTSKQLQWQQQI